jgi:hypothetical protein
VTLRILAVEPSCQVDAFEYKKQLRGLDDHVAFFTAPRHAVSTIFKTFRVLGQTIEQRRSCEMIMPMPR